MKNKEAQWEGFQATYDDCVVKIQVRQPTTSNQFNFNKLAPQIQTKKNINIRKRKKQRSKTLIENNQQQKIISTQQNFVRHSKHIKSQNKIINSPIKTKKNSISSVLSSNQYEKIPIAKYNQNLRGQTVIYSGYFPQTSNKYFINYLRKKNHQQSFIKASLIKHTSDLMNVSGTFNYKPNRLQFDSKFQSGNLAYVTQNYKIKQPEEYNLFMKVDTNTYGHRQWFYFSLKSFVKQTVRLNIYKFKKRWSLFQKGMKPYGSRDGKQWYPIGKKITYNLDQQTDLKMSNTSYNNDIDNTPSYFLSFLLDLQQNQTIFISSGIPYTFSYLKERIKDWQDYEDDELKIKTNYNNKTFGGIDLPIITIQSKMEKNIDQKNKYIIIISRTHPGETSSSWVADGILQYLAMELSDNEINLMKKFNIVFKIVPMMNPDGVVMGNYRTGILGQDFNRKFLSSKDILYPQIDCLKKLILNCKKNGSVQLFLDLHGHSVKKNSFIYAPDQNQFQDGLFSKLSQQLEQCRYFSFQDCKFKNQIKKIQTARVFFQIREQILSMTCQNSLGLFYDKKRFHTYQFRDQNWKQFGKEIVTSLFQIINKKTTILSQPPKEKIRKSSWGLKQQQQEMFFSSQSRSKTCEILMLQDQIKKLNNFQKSQIKISLNKPNLQIKTNKKNKISSSSNSNDVLADIQINEIKQIPQEQNESINDTDDQSQNLPKNQRKKLFLQVQKIISRPNYRKNRGSKNKSEQDEKQQNDFLKKKESYDKPNGINRFKQYRFGNNQFGMTLTSWQKKKALLAMPKSIRNQIQSVQRSSNKNKDQNYQTQIRANCISLESQNAPTHQRQKSIEQRVISSLFFKNKLKNQNSKLKEEEQNQKLEFQDSKIKIDTSKRKKQRQPNNKVSNHRLIKNTKLQSYFISIRKQINPNLPKK